MDFTQRITRMYEVYAPEKVARVPAFLASNAGREEEVLSKLIEKYGPEPDAPVQSSTGGGGGGSNGAHPLHSESYSHSPPPPVGAAQGSSPTFSPLNASPNGHPFDIMQDLRHQVRQDCGFLTKEHELMWEDAWMGRMPLGTLRKTWELNRSVLLSGLGNKMSSHARPVRRWQKRYFVLAPPFLYYFNADQPTAICKGALYLDRATITDDPLNGVQAITILSRVTKKPLQLDRRGDYSTFIIGFDTDKQHATWLRMLQQVTLIGDVGSSAKSFGAYPLSGADMLNVIAGNRQGMPGSPAANAISPQSGDATLAAIAMLNSSSQPVHAPPGLTQSQFQQQQLNQLTSMGVTPQLLHAATLSGAQKSQVHPMFNNFMVAAPEIKQRIERLSRDRDPVRMSEVFLQFVQDHVDNAHLLWKLMASLEEIEPFSGPTYTQAQHHLNHINGYGGFGATPGVLPQQALVHAHRQLFSSRNQAEDQSQLLLQEHQRQAGFSAMQNLPSASFFAPPALLGSESVLSGDVHRQDLSSVMLRAAANQSVLPQQQTLERGLSVSNAGLHSSVDDSEWQRRIGRIRDRKHLVDKLMRDLPQH